MSGAARCVFLVATDVAARAHRYSRSSHVFQYEPPEDPEAYIHRAGRTGRMGSSGVVISLVAEMENSSCRASRAYYGITMDERPLPSDEEIERVVTANA